MTVIVHFRSLDDLDWNRKMLNVEDDTDLLGSINRFRVCIFQVDWINFYCNLMWLSKLLQTLPVFLRRMQFWSVAMYPIDPNVMIAMNYANPLQTRRIRSGNPYLIHIYLVKGCHLTSHQKGSLVRENILFEGHVGVWTIIVDGSFHGSEIPNNHRFGWC